jgi:hypothetical protein
MLLSGHYALQLCLSDFIWQSCFSCHWMNGNAEQGSFFKANRPERPAAHGICPMRVGPSSILVIASIGSLRPPQVGCTVECLVGILHVHGKQIVFWGLCGVRGHNPKQSNIKSELGRSASIRGTWGALLVRGKRLARETLHACVLQLFWLLLVSMTLLKVGAVNNLACICICR